MHRLLIVDDEPHVTDWLVELFTGREDMPLDVFKAYSAKSALEWLSRSRIDIVLTDINMPKMNGLEMMKVIRSSWPECKVVFLTGHNDFEYAYEAIRNEASGYVLKTESDREIVAAVEKAMRQIEESHRIESLVHKSREQFGQALPLLRKDFAMGLLAGLPESRAALQDRLAELNIPLKEDCPVHVLLGRMDNSPAGRKPAGGDERRFQINVAVERFMGFSCHIFFSPMEGQYMLWLLQPKDHSENKEGYKADALSPGNPGVFLRDTLDTVQASVRESLSCTVSFALADAACQWADIPPRCGVLKEMLDISTGVELVATDLGFEKFHAQDDTSEPILRPGSAEKFEACLDKGDRAGAAALIAELAGGLNPAKGMNYAPAVEAYFTLSLRLLSHINRKNLAEHVPASAGLGRLMRPDEHGSWEAASAYLARVASSVLEAQSGRLCDMEEDIVNQVKRYVDGHLGCDVSLVRLAEVVHFNPSYLSRFFKQITGMNLTDYIFNAKISRAKALLADSRVKIHEAASAVGFESSTYFAKFFRRITGLNPQEYRDSLNK